MTALPPQWAVSHLAEVAQLALGKMLDRAKRTAGRPLPYLRNINVRWGHFELSDLLQMPFEENELERYELRKGDVLICEGGEPGRAAVWPGSADVILFQKALHRVRCSKALEPQWLVYQLKHDAERGLLSQHFTGTTIKHFTGSALREYPVALPPLNEQRRIVAKLDDLLARSRRAKEALDSIPAMLERFRQSVLAAAFRGDLTRDWREANPHVEPASKLLERIRSEQRQRWEKAELKRMRDAGKAPRDDRWKERYEEPLGVDGEGLPQLPEGWCWVRVAEVSEVIDPNPSHRNPKYVAEGLPFISTQEFVDPDEILLDCERRVSEETVLEQEQRCGFSGRSILFSRKGTIGKTRMFPAGKRIALLDSLCVINPDIHVNERFVRLVLDASGVNLAQAVRGVALPQVSVGRVRDLVIPLAPVEEQEELSNRVQTALQFLRGIATAVSSALSGVQGLQRALMEKAFRGDLVPQDPADEPASVLLERLRAERDQSADNEHAPRPKRRRATKVA